MAKKAIIRPQEWREWWQKSNPDWKVMTNSENDLLKSSYGSEWISASSQIIKDYFQRMETFFDQLYQDIEDEYQVWQLTSLPLLFALQWFHVFRDSPQKKPWQI